MPHPHRLLTLRHLVLLVTLALLTGCSMFQSTPIPELLVTVDDAGYNPATLEMTIGERVKLTLNNVAAQEHQLAIQEIAIVNRGGGMGDMPGMNMSGSSSDMSNMANMPQLHLVAAAGAQNSLEFTPAQADQYEFFCILPNHRERGQLTVKNR